jgi:hypothetical protein
MGSAYLMEATLDKEREGIISTAKEAVVETARVGLEVAVAGIRSGR